LTILGRKLIKKDKKARKNYSTGAISGGAISGPVLPSNSFVLSMTLLSYAYLLFLPLTWRSPNFDEKAVLSNWLYPQ
jgi:hypothetical protein